MWIYRVHSCISAIDAKVIVVSVFGTRSIYLNINSTHDFRYQAPSCLLLVGGGSLHGHKATKSEQKKGILFMQVLKNKYEKGKYANPYILYQLILCDRNNNPLLSLITIPECKQQVLEICHQFYNEDCLQVTIIL